MNKLKKIFSIFTAFVMCLASVRYYGSDAYAFADGYNSLGYEITEMIFSDDFEDGNADNNYNLFEITGGSTIVEETNGVLTCTKESGKNGYSTMNIALSDNGRSFDTGYYFLELDMRRTCGKNAYLWISHLADISGTSSLDFVRTRFRGDKFFDDKICDDINIGNDEFVHLTFLLDLTEKRYYSWVNGQKMAVDEESLFKTPQGINSVRLVLPYSDEAVGAEIDNIAFYRTELDDELSAKMDSEALSYETLVRTAPDGSDITRINSDLYLPATGRNGSTIVWKSSDESVISTSGDVIPQAGDTVVILTAEITKGGHTFSREFRFTVTEREGSGDFYYSINSVIREDNFDDGQLSDAYDLYAGSADNEFGVISEKDGAFRFDWNGTNAADAYADIYLSPDGRALSDGMYCVEFDIKKTTALPVRLLGCSEIAESGSSVDLFRLGLGNDNIYDERSEEKFAVKNGYYNHITLLYDTAENTYYVWLDGEPIIYRREAIYEKDFISVLRIVMDGGVSAYSVMIDNLYVYDINAAEYFEHANELRLRKDMDYITENVLTSENPDEIKMSLNFMSQGPYGSDITWNTTSTEYINNVGRVTRPRESEENSDVTVTASFSLGNSVGEKKLDFTVVADEKFVDPQIMTDEEFFGEWDSQSNAMLKRGKLDYSYSKDLNPVLECVKVSDYQGAKKALLEYFKNRQDRYTIKISDRLSIAANMFADGWVYSQGNYFAAEMFADNEYLQATADIPVNKIVAGDYSTLRVAPWYNEASWCEIYGIGAADSSLRPKLEVVADGKTKVFEAMDEGIVRAGEYMTKHVESDSEILRIRKYGQYLCDEEYNAVFKFDLRSLGIDADVESVKLILTCRSDTETTEGKKLLVMREVSNAWNGDNLTWHSIGGYIYSNVGLPEGQHWDHWAPYCNTEYMKQASRFDPMLYCAVEYKVTKDERYAYYALKAAGDIINDFGDYEPSPAADYGNFKPTGNDSARGQYTRTIDAGGRMQNLTETFSIYCNSESMTPDYCTAIVKHIWDIGHSLRVRHRTYSTNWQQMEMQGLYHVAHGFPEFYDVVGDDGEDWRTYGFGVLENYIIEGYEDDGVYLEPTGGYSQNVLRGFAGILQRMKKDGYEMKPENRERLRNATYYNLLLRTPNGSVLAYGDETQAEGDGKGESFPQFSELFEDDEMKYVDSFGRYGTEPEWTSRHFPVGRVTFMRSDWSTNALYLFSPLRGRSVSSHGHSDDNQVIVAAFGRTLLTDQGKFNYDADAQTLWGRSTEGHNTVSINDKSQELGIHNGVVHQWTGGEKFDFLSQSTYANPGYEHRRTVMFVKPNYFIVSDRITPDDMSKVNTYKQHWHMHPDALISSDTASSQFRSNYSHGANIIVASADEDVTANLGDGWWSKNYGNSIETKWSFYTQSTAGTATFNTVLLPYEYGRASVKTEKLAVDADESKASAMMIVTDVNGEVSNDYYYFSYEDAHGTASFGEYTTDARVAFISTDENGQIKSLIMKDGSYIKQGGTILIDTGSAVSDISVEYDDGKLYIDYGESVSMSEITLPGMISALSVYVNGEQRVFEADDSSLVWSEEAVKSESGFIGAGAVVGSNSNGETGSGSSNGGSGGVASPGGVGGGVNQGGTAGVGTGASTTVFADVSGHWAQDTINNLYQLGIVKGKTATSYCPDETLSRSEAIALLCRSIGIKAVHNTECFDDVNDEDWFYSEVSAAFEHGLISEDTFFRPYDSITREEMAKLVVGFYELKNNSELKNAELTFEDGARISDWAVGYIEKGVSGGLISGDDKNCFAPKRNVTRAEAAVFVWRIINN